ncbi:MAG TPA: MiaB/RimO family radical SAM methylthiotransferase [Gemmatimonadaceae bacterium]
MRVYLRTFGCRANQYDTESVRAMVEAAGHFVVSDPDDADLAVFNSCAVTAEAEADLRKAVRRAARGHPALKSVIMGCASALPRPERGPTSLRELPTVQHVVPGADFALLAEALGLPLDVGVRAAQQAGTRALLRIQDGCDEHCTFCTTTQARGANRSRTARELVDEAKRLGERHPEIVITGIHIGSFGLDTGSSLGALLQQLVREVPATRFRLSSLEATEVDDAIFELLVDPSSGVAAHLHAPLQSGSDRILKRMGRHWYTARSYAARVEQLAAAAPVLGLGADVIAGFPGESIDDHAATMALIEALPFTYLHVFPYSVRPGTPAERLPDHVHSATIADRAAELRGLADRKAAAHAAARSGTEADVVVIRDLVNGTREGITEDYLTVAVQGSAEPGTRIRARLEARDGGLVAVPRHNGDR